MVLARDLRIKFYDASYVFWARELGVPLVTEDEGLIQKVGGVVDAFRLDRPLR
ncbi:MAG: hypothetical protein RMJ28_07155 [Nitrososphaerota archaeon]|nr:hypothetical protein [Candidatus Calditenuaceae archaeon]MDW8073992.1 hypothetical protein [Nitrososphaerota archaeon]